MVSFLINLVKVHYTKLHTICQNPRPGGFRGGGVLIKLLTMDDRHLLMAIAHSELMAQVS